jgi:hypothetical protein
MKKGILIGRSLGRSKEIAGVTMFKSAGHKTGAKATTSTFPGDVGMIENPKRISLTNVFKMVDGRKTAAFPRSMPSMVKRSMSLPGLPSVGNQNIGSAAVVTSTASGSGNAMAQAQKAAYDKMKSAFNTTPPKPTARENALWKAEQNSPYMKMAKKAKQDKARNIQAGPKGGRYYVTENGTKVYV